jgi:hypothetical protein
VETACVEDQKGLAAQVCSIGATGEPRLRDGLTAVIRDKLSLFLFIILIVIIVR